MKTLNLSVRQKPERKNGYTIVRSEIREVRVDRIRKRNRYYEACLSHADEDAPHDSSSPTRLGIGEGENWLFFTKVDNPNHGIPVMKEGEEIEV